MVIEWDNLDSNIRNSESLVGAFQETFLDLYKTL